MINVGVIGCGYWGPNLIRNFRSLSNCSVRWVCDLDERRTRHMRSLYPDVSTTAEVEQILSDSDVKAVAVATPVSTHYRITRACLEAGRHVLVEKPMALSSEECVDLLRLAHEHSVTLMVGHTFLYTPVVRRIKEIIWQGDLGEVLYIHSRRLNLGLYQKDINVAWDLAPHDLSIILYLLEEVPISVNCQGRAHHPGGVEDVVNISLRFRKGRFATIHNSWLDPNKVREMTIVGTRRMLLYNDIEPMEKIRIFDKRVETPPYYDTFAEFQYSYHYGDVYVPYIKQIEPLKVECEHFLNCVETGGRPLSDGLSAMQVVQILEGATESLRREGNQVSLAEMVRSNRDVIATSEEREQVAATAS